MQLLLASRNTGKRAELQSLLEQQGIAGIELLGLNDVEEYPETPETGATFAENALIKSHDGLAHAGLATLADDSGICVDALNGMPGVLSARWSGRHGDDAANNELLLGQLSDTLQFRRGAHYTSVCSVSLPAELALRAGLDEDIVVEGRWFGHIAPTPQGENGFGYDPLFIPGEGIPDHTSQEGHYITAAQMSPEEKNAVSHRAKALDQLVPVLKKLAEATQ